jgi:hypothetical protein
LSRASRGSKPTHSNITIQGARHTSASVKVFGCRPFAEACRRAETGPAFENLQGRKPRVGRAPIRRTRYGDLRVASVCWRVVAMTIKDDFEG